MLRSRACCFDLHRFSSILASSTSDFSGRSNVFHTFVSPPRVPGHPAEMNDVFFYPPLSRCESHHCHAPYAHPLSFRRGHGPLLFLPSGFPGSGCSGADIELVGSSGRSFRVRLTLIPFLNSFFATPFSFSQTSRAVFLLFRRKGKDFLILPLSSSLFSLKGRVVLFHRREGCPCGRIWKPRPPKPRHAEARYLATGSFLPPF